MAGMLEMERAGHAWNCINKVRKAVQQEYVARARSLSADVLSGGLGQALATLYYKGKVGTNPAEKDKNAEALLYDHISGWVTSRAKKNGSLLELLIAPGADQFYRWATGETLAYLVWIKKLAVGTFEKEGASGDVAAGAGQDASGTEEGGQV
jgi:CRISPR type III-B/RAMP module-associated protein Cmr5